MTAFNGDNAHYPPTPAPTQMAPQTPPDAPQPLLIRSARLMIVGIVGALIAALVFAAATYFLTVRPIVEQFTRTPIQVEGTAVSERETTMTVGSRRTRRIEDVRLVKFEFQVDGTTQSDEIQDNPRDFEVGNTSTFWYDAADGQLTTERPQYSNGWTWAGLVAGLLITFGSIALFVSNIQSSKLYKNARPDLRSDRLTLTLFDIQRTVHTSKYRKKQSFEYIFSGNVTASTNPKLPIGSSVSIETSRALPLPPLPDRIPSLEVVQGDPKDEPKETAIAIVRLFPGSPWFAAKATLNKPKNAAKAPVQ